MFVPPKIRTSLPPMIAALVLWFATPQEIRGKVRIDCVLEMKLDLSVALSTHIFFDILSPTACFLEANPADRWCTLEDTVEDGATYEFLRVDEGDSGSFSWESNKENANPVLYRKFH